MKKRGCCEEVGDFRDCGIEQWTWRAEKGDCNFDDGDRGTSCKEVADEHSERDNDCDIVFEDRRPDMLAFAFQYAVKEVPIEGIIRILRGSRNKNYFMSIMMSKTKSAKGIDLFLVNLMIESLRDIHVDDVTIN